MYRLSAFYFARTASDLPMDCTIPTVFIIIIYFMSGLKCAISRLVAAPPDANVQRHIHTASCRQLVSPVCRCGIAPCSCERNVQLGCLNPVGCLHREHHILSFLTRSDPCTMPP